MTRTKQHYLSHFLWLQCLLTETTEVIDELQGSHLYKHRLKQSISKAQDEIDNLFKRKELKEFYSSGGGDGLTEVTKVLEQMRNEMIEGITDES